jgi:iron transport multicopper oxidase
VTLNLNLDFDSTKKQFLVNDVSFKPPSVPVLLQILSGSMQASSLLPNGSIFTLPRNKVVEISIPPGGAIEGPHPFHLHGHPFDVIRPAGNSSYNYDNPVRRDVASIGDPGDNVTIRFFTNNPGPWLLHCHIETHLDMGLAIVFAEESQDMASTNHVTSDWEQLCPKFNKFSAGARSVNAARRLSPIPFWLSMQVFQNAWSLARRCLVWFWILIEIREPAPTIMDMDFRETIQ